MGYWNTTFTEVSTREVSGVWGDKPADVMDAAMDLIAAIFLTEMGRFPTQGELLNGARSSAQWVGLYADRNKSLDPGAGEEIPERVRLMVERFNKADINDMLGIANALVSK
jgi:hypothetical protein